MEPAGVMENQQDPSARYEELIGKHKKNDDNLLKGAKPTDLYCENSKATSAANEKPGGDDLLNKQAADR
ncbi:g8459 [Coccomyxa elongata]